MIYANTDGSLIGFGMDALRRSRPNVSIPDNPSAADLAHLGVVDVEEPLRPSDTPLDRYRATTTLVNGEVVASWVADSVADRAAGLAAWRDQLVSAVKAEAARRIEARVPPWKQRNLIAFAVDMADKRIGGGQMTPVERQQYDAAKTVWAWVRSVRTASDAIETRIQSMTDTEAGVFNVETAFEWPTT